MCGNINLVLGEFGDDFRLKLSQNEISKKLIFTKLVNKNYLQSGVLLSGGVYHKTTFMKSSENLLVSPITTDSNAGLKRFELPR